MSTARVKSAKAKKKRSRALTVEDAALKAVRKAAREAKRIEKFAERWQEIRKAVRAHARERFTARTLQEAGVQWLMGYDTPAAKLFASYVEQEESATKEALRQKQKAGDPLNITGHTPVMSEKKRRKQDEVDRLARGERKIVIPDPDSPNQNVMVSTLPHSLRRMKLKLHQEQGAEKFLADHEAAVYSGLSSMGFDPRVDSSPKQTAGYVRAAEAQTRLRLAEKELGRRNWVIVRGVLLYNWNATKAHAAGARQHVIVQNDIDVALNALATFYDPVRMQRDPTWDAFERMVEAGKAVIVEAERQLNDPASMRSRPKARRSVR
jgi:hypothetical protein